MNKTINCGAAEVARRTQRLLGALCDSLRALCLRLKRQGVGPSIIFV